MKDPGERARWLSAVLIVVSIVAVTAIVRLWPAALEVHATRALASHPLRLVDAPAVAPGIPASVFSPAPVKRAADSAPMPGALPAVVVEAFNIVETTARPASDELDATPSPAESLPLASRSIDIPRFEPVAVVQTRLAHVTEESHTTSFVEIPVVVMSRALEVAGRGIKTSVRATGALVRLAF